MVTSNQTPKSAPVGTTPSGGTIRRLLGSQGTDGIRAPKGEKSAAQFRPASIELGEKDGVEGYYIFVPRQPTQNEDQVKSNRITFGSSHGPKPAMITDSEGTRGRLVTNLNDQDWEVSFSAVVMGQEAGQAAANRKAKKAAK